MSWSISTLRLRTNEIHYALKSTRPTLRIGNDEGLGVRSFIICCNTKLMGPDLLKNSAKIICV